MTRRPETSPMLSLSRFDCKRRRRVRHAIEGALRCCTDDANGEAQAETLEVLKSRAVAVSVGERLRSDTSLTFGNKPSNWAAFVGKNIASSLILRITDRKERGKRPEFSLKRIYSYKILETGSSSSLEEQDLATATVASRDAEILALDDISLAYNTLARIESKGQSVEFQGNLVQGDVERTAVEVLRTNMDRAMQQCFQDVMRIAVVQRPSGDKCVAICRFVESRLKQLYPGAWHVVVAKDAFQESIAELDSARCILGKARSFFIFAHEIEKGNGGTGDVGSFVLAVAAKVLSAIILITMIWPDTFQWFQPFLSTMIIANILLAVGFPEAFSWQQGG